MQHKHKPHLDCGIDGINVMFSSNYDLEQEVYNPKEFVLAHKDICELDYSFIKYGLAEKYGGNKRTAQKTASRLKTELADRINFTEGLIEELRLLKKLLLAM